MLPRPSGQQVSSRNPVQLFLWKVAVQIRETVCLQNPEADGLWLAGAVAIMRFRKAFVKYFVVFFLLHYKKSAEQGHFYSANNSTFMRNLLFSVEYVLLVDRVSRPFWLL